MSTYSTSVSTSTSQSAAVAEDLKQNLAIAKFSLDILVCICALGSSIWLLVVRRRSKYDLKALPMWTVLGSVTSVFLYEVFALPSEGQNILKTSNSSKAYIDFSYPGSIIGAFFRHATICALFYIFYRTIHVCLDVLSAGTKPPRWIRNLHSGILGVILITAVIDWAFYIQQMLSQKSRSSGHSVKAMSDIVNRMYDIELACSIIRWISSMEILAWTIYLATKTIKTRAKIRTPSIFLLFSSVFLFALNMMWAIYYINLFVTTNIVATTISGVGLIQTIFILLIYLGLLPFCVRWGMVCWDNWGNSERDLLDLGQIARQDEAQIHQSPAEMDASTKPSFISEADSRMVLEAGEPKPIVEADGSMPIVEADSRTVIKYQNESPPRYEKLDQSEISRES